jgi:hydrogenase maturation protease
MGICLMSIGNVLMGDDALGPWVLESLASVWEFPPDVSLIDAGTPGLDLTLFLDGFDALIVVDAIQAPGAPGDVRTYRRAELLKGALPVVLSPHEPTLREALMRLEMLGRCPRDVLLVGAVPEQVGTGTGLSRRVRRAIPRIEAEVLGELERLGSRPTPRVIPMVPDIWWERKPACASASPAG